MPSCAQGNDRSPMTLSPRHSRASPVCSDLSDVDPGSRELERASRTRPAG